MSNQSSHTDIWGNEREEVAADVPRLLLQVIVILGVAKVLGKLLAYIRQPAVIGELLGGVLLGPSVLGASPDFKNFLFPAQSVRVLYLVAQVGLIFFMFFLGLEIQPSAVFGFWKEALPLAVISIAVPIVIGMAMGAWFHELCGVSSDAVGGPFGFSLFFAVALAFAALTAIGRILSSAKGGHALLSKVGLLTIAVATVDDLFAWTILALTLLAIQGGTPTIGLLNVFLMCLYLAFQFFVVRLVLAKIYKYLGDRGRETDTNFIVGIFFLLLLSAWIAEVIGVHAFFGAFFFGLMLPKDGELTEFLGPRVELLIVNVFVPLYFAYSGLNTNLRELADPAVVFATIFFAIISSCAKGGPVFVLMYYRFKYDWYESVSISILIQARGLVSLITANIGYKAGIFNSKSFAVIILATLITMCCASPVFYTIYEKHLMQRYENLEDDKELTEGHPRSSSRAEPDSPSMKRGARSPGEDDDDEEQQKKDSGSSGVKPQRRAQYDPEESITHDQDREESLSKTGDDLDEKRTTTSTPPPEKKSTQQQKGTPREGTPKTEKSRLTSPAGGGGGGRRISDEGNLPSRQNSNASGRSTPRRDRELSFKLNRPHDW